MTAETGVENTSNATSSKAVNVGGDKSPPYGEGTEQNPCDDCPTVPSRHCCYFFQEDDVDDDVTPTELDLAYEAWTVIANVSEGDWSKQTDEWQGAAVRWRDRFHAALSESRG